MKDRGLADHVFVMIARVQLAASVLATQKDSQMLTTGDPLVHWPQRCTAPYRKCKEVQRAFEEKSPEKVSGMAW